MKKKLLTVSILATISSLSAIAYASSHTSVTTTTVSSNNSATTSVSTTNSTETDDVSQPVAPSQNPKIQQFMSQQQLSSDFPFRLNLPTSGQTAKNNAGIRIAETAQQLSSDTTGLFFYYKLFDHAMRVPHWHANATEIGMVLSGKMRVTIWEGKGKPHIFLVEKNAAWTIPPATLHSLENVDNSPLTFVVSYNSPNAADRDFATAWSALPDAMLEQALGLTANEIADIRKTTINRLSKYDPAGTEKLDANSPFTGSFSKAKPIYQSPRGLIRRLDTKDIPNMHGMSLQQTILKPNMMRQPHWYLGGDTFLYVYKGTAFFTMMDNDGKVYNVTVNPGDVVYIPVGVFHSYINIGASDLELVEVFQGNQISEISLLNGSQTMNPKVLAGATGISTSTAQRLTQKKRDDAYIISFT